MAEQTGGPHRGHAAGDTDIEKQASQLASDVKYKVKRRMGSQTDMNPAQVAKAYLAQLASSPAPSTVKALARKKLSAGVSEEYGIEEFAKKSVVNALVKVFVEGVVKEEVEEISESDEKKYWIVVTDKKTGNTYRRQATRAKIAELRSNPNIRRVEITGYHPKETDDKQGKKTSRVKSGKGLDPVGKEDNDPDNDGVPISRDKNDQYIMKRRAAVGRAIASRGTQKEEFIGETKKAKKKSTDTITGEGVNNTKYINTKPTMEQTEPAGSTTRPDEEEANQKLKLKQKQVQLALTRQRQTMQLQRTGRLPLNYSDDYTPEGKLVDEKFSTQYGKPGKLGQSSQRKSLGKRSSIKDGSKPTGYESPKEFRDTEMKYQKNSFELEGESVYEVAPPGFEGTVKAMKKYPELSKGKTSEGKDKNIYALAWFMKNKGYKSHKKASGADKEVQKNSYELEGSLVDEATRAAKEGKKDEHRVGVAIRAKQSAETLAAKRARQKVLDAHEKKTGTKLDISKTPEGQKHAQHFGGSRQPKMRKGAKETDLETHNRRVGRQVARVVKHGYTSKEKKEVEAMSKHASPRD